MSRSPSDEARHQFDSKLWIGRLFGVYNFDGRELNPRLAVTLLLGVLEQVMHYQGLREAWPDIAQICNLMIVHCLLLELIVRLASKFIKQEEENIQSMLKTVIAFYEREEKVPGQRQVLLENLKISKFLLNAYPVYSFAIYSIPNPTACILSWYKGEFIQFLPLVLPGTDVKTFTGYIINVIIILFLTMLVFFCFLAADIIFLYFVIQCLPMVDIYCMKLRVFGEDLTKVNSEQIPIELVPPKVSTSRGVNHEWTSSFQRALKQFEDDKAKRVLKVEQRLITLIEEFRVYNEYVLSTTEFMKFTTFFAMSLNSVAIAMSIVVALYYYMVIGGVLCVILFSQVLVPCLQGSFIMHQKEKLLDELAAFPWYELSKPKQKLFLQFIHLCQNSNEFEIQLIGSIDMELFTDVLNGARAYFMYLWSFI